MELYTILYPFFWRELNLKGAVKEVFAVIYGFWAVKRGPCRISNSTIHAITGLSRASIAKAKSLLVEHCLLVIYPASGSAYEYEIVLPRDLLHKLDRPHPKNRQEASSSQTSSSNWPQKLVTMNTNRINSNIIGDKEDFLKVDKI